MRNPTEIKRCIPEFLVKDVSSISRFFQKTLEFTLDVDHYGMDDMSSEDDVAILVAGDIQIRFFKYCNATGNCHVTMECSADLSFWRDRLKEHGYESVFFQEIGSPLLVECQVTDEFRITFEQLS